MSQQKALFLQTPINGEFHVGTRAVPKPGPGQLLVKIHATGLNPLEWKVRAFDFYVETYPAILGADAAGTVEEIGEGVTGFAKGDRVAHQGNIPEDQATYQQYVLVPSELTIKLPENISFDEAASLPSTLATAALALYLDKPSGPNFVPAWEVNGGGLYKGQPIVILGGASSIGQYVIQFAKLSGFSPIITTASAHNEDLLLSLGATHVINRSSADVASEITKALNGTPVKFILDTISLKDTQTLAWDLVSSGGMLVIVLKPEVDADKYKDKTLFHIRGFLQLPSNRDLGMSLLKSLPRLLEDGSIKPNRVEVLPGGLAAIPDGLERLKNGQVSAKKLVVRPQETA